MKVKAISLGFYGGTRRYPGDVFTVKDGESARWWEAVEPEAPAEPLAEKPKRRRGGGDEASVPASTGDQDVI